MIQGDASGYCFDGSDFPNISKRCLTGTDWLSVRMHGASSAECLPTPKLCSFETDEVADRPQERHGWVDSLEDPILSVYRELHRVALVVSINETPTPSVPPYLATRWEAISGNAKAGRRPSCGSLSLQDSRRRALQA
jgi:hypothetical protein